MLSDYEVGSSDQVARPLGGHERLLYLYSKAHPRHFCMVTEFNFGASRADLESALCTVQNRHLMLSFHIDDEAESGPRFLPTPNQIPLTFLPLSSQGDWRRIVETELSTSFETDVGPLMRVTALSSSIRTIVVFTVHHAILDAVSIVAIAEDLGLALKLRPVASAPKVATIEEYVKIRRDACGQPFGQPPPQAQRIAELRERAAEPLWRSFGGDRPRVYIRELDRQSTTSLVSACRENATTVHGALCAAVALSVARQENKSEIVITSPINMRKMLDLDAKATGLLVCVGTVRLPVADHPSFWDLARLARNGLADLTSIPGASSVIERIDATISREADPAIASGFVGSFRYDAIVSNLGRLAVDEVADDIGLTAVWGPFVQGRFINERVIGASTFGGNLRLVQSSPDNIQNCLDDIVECLARG